MDKSYKVWRVMVACTVCCSQLLGEVARGTEGAGDSRDCIAEGGVAMAGE